MSFVLAKIKHTTLFLFFCLLFFQSNEVHASHLAGADISYQCVGNNRYVITIRLYRDCEGISMPTSLNLQIGSAECNLNVTGQILPQDTFYEVSQLCPTDLPNSSCNSTASNALPGYEVYVYTDTVQFPQNCSDWTIGWSTCCRNSSITSLVSAGSFYIEAMINTNYCNDSPVFSSLPTPYFCAGQYYQYSHGASDPEGDTLLFALTCPLEGANICSPNIVGLSPTQPLLTTPANSFGFNQFTGQMSFTPQINTPQVAVAAVTVFNILNGDTIGYVQRDIQMIVLNGINCTTPVNTNNPLVLGGGLFDTLSNSFVICAGDTLIFQIDMSDPDGDTVDILPANTNLDQVFGAANWSIFRLPINGLQDSVRFFVQIIADPGLIGANQFTIGVTDGACPIPGDQILGFNLIIPGVEVVASDTTICPGIAQTIQMTANSFSTVGGNIPGSFQWQQVSGPAITFDDDTISNPIVFVPGSTVDGDSIVLQVTYITLPDPTTGSQCVTTDDVIIYLKTLPLALAISASEVSLCPNNQLDTIDLSTAIGGPGVDLVNGVYSWSAVPATYNDSLTSLVVNNPDFLSSGGPGDSVVLTVSYTYGTCIGSDDITLRWREGIPYVFASSDTICPGDTIALISGLTDTIKILDPAACSTYTVDPITFSPIPGTGSNIFLSDDQLSSGLPIGFSFDFYCNTYNTFYISSNGYISFDPGAGNGCCTGDPIPDAFTPNNFVALSWEDYNPNSGGSINYFTTGVAPNRRLVVNYINVPRFGSTTNVLTGQIILYESTNYIEVHTTVVSADGPTTQGIENSDGTAGVAVPGRNSGIWSASNDAYRFTPGVALLFGPITYNWDPGFAVSDATASNPNAFPQETTTFTVQVNEQGCILQDSIEIFVNSTIPAPVVTCGFPANEATSVLFNWGGSPGATGWEYTLDSGITWIPRAYADSFLLITGLTNGDCSNILVRALGGAGPCPNNAATYLECCTTPCPPPNNGLVSDLSCYEAGDGTLDFAISGGVLGTHPDFTVVLFDTSGTAVDTVTALDTASFSGLASDLYYAFIADTLGCFTFTDTFQINQPIELIVALDTSTLTTCFGTDDGTATISASGGNPTYSFLWDANANNSTATFVSGLAVGTYDVVVTDASGCEDTLQVDISSNFPGPPAISLNVTPNTSCSGNGEITVFTTVNMFGDANLYNYSWTGSGSTTPTASNLPPGTYDVTVTDLNGCTATSSAVVSGQPSLAISNVTQVNPGCNLLDGEISVQGTGDSVGYNYLWSDGQTTAVATGLGVGVYSVTITGQSNGCSDSTTVTLVNLGGVTSSGFNTTNPSCGGTDGQAEVVFTGSNGNVTFNWSSGDTTQIATNLSAGTYTVTLTDAANCVDIQTVTLVQDTISAAINVFNNPNCNLSNGDATVTVSGAPGPFSYAWSNGATDAVAQSLGAGTYTVTATYQACTATATVSLSSESLQINITDKDDIICNGDLSSYAYISATNNSGPVTYQWTGPNGFTSTSDSISGLAAGTYTVVASVGAGCTVSQSITVVDIILQVDPWASTYGSSSAVVQLTEVFDISGGVTTNFANPTFTWTEQNAGLLTLASTVDSLTSVTADESGVTWLYFTATAGPCSATDSVLIDVQSYLGMPTAFTPNGDGINDFFRPAGLTNYAKVFKFIIMNRWGMVVYDDPSNPQWDGTIQGVPQPMDVYLYIFEYAPDNADPIEIRGEFMLIR